jgi:hypothetical protein
MFQISQGILLGVHSWKTPMRIKDMLPLPLLSSLLLQSSLLLLLYHVPKVERLSI